MKQLLTLFFLVSTCTALHAQEETNFYLIQYTPGAKWDDRVSYEAQPGIKAHKAHLQQLYDNDVLMMGGPLVDKKGAMLIVRVDTRQQAQGIVDRDPGVQSQTLAASVSGWRLEMSTMRHFRRAKPGVTDPDVPYRVERVDPQAPINMKD